MWWRWRGWRAAGVVVMVMMIISVFKFPVDMLLTHPKEHLGRHGRNTICGSFTDTNQPTQPWVWDRDLTDLINGWLIFSQWLRDTRKLAPSGGENHITVFDRRIKRISRTGGWYHLPFKKLCIAINCPSGKSKLLVFVNIILPWQKAHLSTSRSKDTCKINMCLSRLLYLLRFEQSNSQIVPTGSN